MNRRSGTARGSAIVVSFPITEVNSHKGFMWLFGCNLIERLEAWLEVVLRDFDERILEFGNEEAQVWSRLRVPYHENAIDKQIAATALTHDLILVTRNVDHFKGPGVRLFNPFD
jgi:hypothetical protein